MSQLDGKRMRKSIQRRTVDYNHSISRWLQVRTCWHCVLGMLVALLSWNALIWLFVSFSSCLQLAPYVKNKRDLPFLRPDPNFIIDVSINVARTFFSQRSLLREKYNAHPSLVQINTPIYFSFSRHQLTPTTPWMLSPPNLYIPQQTRTAARSTSFG